MSKLRDQVTEFHRAFGCPMRERPEHPGGTLLQARLRFLAEEFFEILDAAGCPEIGIRLAKGSVEICIGALDPRQFDMAAFVDGHADLTYFAAGTMVAIGVNDEPIANEVHRANMGKMWSDGKPRYGDGGKIVKPPGWTPPDIEGELRKQGWDPEEIRKIGWQP